MISIDIISGKASTNFSIIVGIASTIAINSVIAACNNCGMAFINDSINCGNTSIIKKEKGVNTTELVIRPPKSSASRREIPLFDKLWNGLMAYRQQQIEIFDMLGLEFTEETYIFCNPMGNVYDPRVFEDLFKRKLEEAGLKEINFHALRHTFATRALEAGMDVKVLSALIGHAQPSTTLNLYGQALPDHKKASMEKMSGFYTGRLDTNEIRTQMERIAS